MNKEYRVESVTDFLSIPVEKIPAMLNDFQQWLLLAHMVRQNEELNKLIKPEVYFVWVDDGIEGISKIILKNGDKEAFTIDLSKEVK